MHYKLGEVTWLVDGVPLARLGLIPDGYHFAVGALRGEDGGLGGHHGWAECSLVMAENVLVEKMGLKPPAWIDAAVYHEYVKYNKTKAAKRGGWAQG